MKHWLPRLPLPPGLRDPLAQLAAPVLIIMVLAMMVLPLPVFLLDVFFTFNIALSLMVILVALYLSRPLDFSAFPTVLLVTTLLRLSLNVASTRIVLLHGHEGGDAAGKVIEAFGHFIVGGNTAVGLVVFVILTIINFVVITKGAGRIAEVSARFTLDAMPGKQMAIDADLNAGLINEAEAKRRRREIAQEAEFFGSMDGASKFVRGDAVAGILIMLINVVGGLFIGVVQHDLALGEAARTYTLLTIGDGLVAQIPALIISVAAGLVVARVGDEGDLGSQVFRQLFANRQVLMIAAAIVGLLGLIPGMPNGVFLLLASTLGGVAWWQGQRAASGREDPPTGGVSAALDTPEPLDATWQDVAPVDVLGVDVGFRLIPLVDLQQDGELLRRIRGLRKRFAQEVGFLCAPIHIRDNLDFPPNRYAILLKGVELGAGEVYPGQYLAIDGGAVTQAVAGRHTTDPTFGLPAVWIDATRREEAQARGYTVVDPGTVVTTHLDQLMKRHAGELLGRQETQALLDHVGQDAPKLIEELVPKLLPLSSVQRVLQNLLDEEVAIRDMRTILDVLAEYAPLTQEAMVLTAKVREALGRAIVQALFPGPSAVEVLTLDPALEGLFHQALAQGAEQAVLEPGLAEAVLTRTAALAWVQEAQGRPAVLLAPAASRWWLARFLRRAVPTLRVVANTEIPDSRLIRVVGVIGAAAES